MPSALNQGDLVTRKSGSPVMVVIGGVRANPPPNDYTIVTCLWYDGDQRHSRA